MSEVCNHPPTRIIFHMSAHNNSVDSTVTGKTDRISIKLDEEDSFKFDVILTVHHR